jgi:hypothetical protein
MQTQRHLEDYGSKIETKEKAGSRNLDDTSGVAESMAADVVCKDQMLSCCGHTLVAFFHCRRPD